MKIKKLFVLVGILFFSILLTSCVTVTDNVDKFVDKLYDKQMGKVTGLVVDLRTRGTDKEEEGTYAGGHISGAQSFDVHQDKDFDKWITKLTSTNSTIYLVDSGKEEYVPILEILEELGYKNIIVYTEGYETLRASEAFIEAIYESTGLEDCGCE
ncbi:MAG: rhodanese-like domain-containing protein [Bacilli bacterium]|nr:rhodanese-like domain-containing protein [Bacilli bacterium]